VAKGISQVPGNNFTESFAPDMTYLDFRLALSIKVLKNLSTGQINIKTAFLYLDFYEAIYVKLPDGFVKWDLEVKYEVFDQ
jgi:Reverse transcriptase (RNA-dependent DNA polymerase)